MNVIIRFLTNKVLNKIWDFGKSYIKRKIEKKKKEPPKPPKISK